MAVYNGYNGSVKVGSTPTAVGEVTNFNVTISADVVETSQLGSAWASNTSALKRWNGSVTANFDFDDAGQALLVAGSKVALVLNAGNGATISGDAIVGDNQYTNDVGGIVTKTFSFTGTGQATVAEVA